MAGGDVEEDCITAGVNGDNSRLVDLTGSLERITPERTTTGVMGRMGVMRCYSCLRKQDAAMALCYQLDIQSVDIKWWGHHSPSPAMEPALLDQRY